MFNSFFSLCEIRETIRFEVFTAMTTKMPSSGMLCRMALIRNDVFEEDKADIFILMMEAVYSSDISVLT
jgi:hypothetical protein